MHFQFPPAAETKLVRCTRGAILDIIVDLRPESPTYLAARRGRARRGQRPRALRPRALRSRLPDARRRHRDELPRRRVLHAGRRGRACATTIRGSGSSWPLPVVGDVGEGLAAGRASTTSSPSCARRMEVSRDHRRHRAEGARGRGPPDPRRHRRRRLHGAGPDEPDRQQRPRHARRRRSRTVGRERAVDAFRYAGLEPRRRRLAERSSTTPSAAGGAAVTDDPFLLCRSEHVDVICRGHRLGRVRRARRARGVRARQGRRADERRARRDDRSDPRRLRRQARRDPVRLRRRRAGRPDRTSTAG